MSDYNPPNITNIVFNFSSDGYIKPDFDAINFTSQLRPSYVSISDISASIKAILNTSTSDLHSFTRPSYRSASALNASIEIMQLYQDTTYTYVKERRSVVVGYSTKGVQTLNLPYLYGGIRDLGAFVLPQPPHADLAAYIESAVAALNLSAFVRPNIRSSKSLLSYTRPVTTGAANLSAFHRYAIRGSKYLTSYTKFIRGSKIEKDLSALIQDVQPVDIDAYLNVIEIRNLTTYVKGVWLNSSADLQTSFMKLFYRQGADLHSTLHGYQTFDLNARILSFWTKDLSAELNAGFFAIHKDLQTLLLSIDPVNLLSYLHGYDTKNLSATITQGYGLYSMQSYLNPVLPRDLLAYVKGYEAIKQPKDLKAYVSSFKTEDLLAYINTIEYKQLLAYIDAVGKYKDLTAFIVPKTINIKRVLLVPLLEHKDIFATINYNCRLSGYKDLQASMYLIFKKDLRASIIGWNQGTADNVVDLKALINTGDYSYINTIDVSFVAHPYNSVMYDISGGTFKNYKTFNVFNILGGPAIKNLAASIYANPTASNLNAFIRARPVANFATVPDWVKPKDREVVINLNRFESRWRRFINLMFFTNSEDDYHYFYVSGANKVYKVDKNRTWVIWVTGYSYNPDSIYDRVGSRRKIIFNLNKYETIDAAIRDMIDLAAEFRERDLNAEINCVLGNHKNLTADIEIKTKYSWSRNLLSVLKCTNFGQSNVAGNIQPELYQDSNNLSVSIVGKSYEPPQPDNVKFVFDEPGYIPQSPYRNIDWTFKQAVDFWKED
jgi:hypothetical protein